MTATALAVRAVGLSKTYATRVVSDVSLEVAPGRVHALLGGNGSGKSTLLKMLAGVVPADPGGTIDLPGRRIATGEYTATDAAAGGLRFVHQDLGLVDTLSLAENFGLAAGYPTRGGRRGPRWGSAWVDDRALITRTRADLERAGLHFDPRMPAGALRPSDRARVAIARALRDSTGEDGTGEGGSGEGGTVGVRTLVLDEPTASLPVAEVAQLLHALRDLRAAGHAVVFVTHRLSEVLAVADDVTVLRDGRVAGTGPVADFDENSILTLIAGHAPERLARRERVHTAAPVQLSVRGLTAGPLVDVDLDAHRGEIVGVAGLVGAGRTSLLRALFGDLPVAPVSTVAVAGQAVVLRSTADAVAAGIALVPEDRARESAFLDASVWENLSAASLGRYRTWAGVSARAERRAAPDLMRRFRVRAPSPSATLAALSGGNQQKVVFARWLQTEPRVLLLDEPTQGVDAVARDEIHRAVREAVDHGACALVVSSDIEELEQLCDRVVVLRGGRAVRTLSGAEVRRHTITAAIQQEDRVAS